MREDVCLGETRPVRPARHTHAHKARHTTNEGPFVVEREAGGGREDEVGGEKYGEERREAREKMVRDGR